MVPGVSNAVGGAAFTTTNIAEDGAGHCFNGSGTADAINCNIYDGKEFVWIIGGPDANHLKPDGTYFFAVLEPGGQHDPNDQSPVAADNNLSDDFDTYLNRRFTTVNGEITTYVPDADGATADHDFVGGKIRLDPYTLSTNPGGVHILAICSLGAAGTDYPVSPSDCKYDAFKIKLPNAPVLVNAVLSGAKYRDDNRDGDWDDATEPGLQGWSINLDCDDNTFDTGLSPAITDVDGLWSITTPNAASIAGTVTCTVYETQQTGWTQTGNTTDQTSVLGGATSCLAGACTTSPGAFIYKITFPTDAVATVDGLNFGNVPNAGISGLKYYDANENGQWDTGEVGLEGWPIRVDGVLTFTTDVNGAFSGTLLPKTTAPLHYSIAEQQSLTGGWVQTGNTVDQFVIAPTSSAAVSLTSFVYSVTPSATTPSTITGLNFGNVCETTPGGRTIGFWSNKNGRALITVADIAALDAMDLRNANGTAFDPGAGSGTLLQDIAAYRTWLLSANASNMAYMLSAQLSATYLNIVHGFTNPTTLVTVSGLPGTLTVQAVVDEAKNILANPIIATLSTVTGVLGGDGAHTIASGVVRTHQGNVKDSLDTINNSNAFTQPTPATCPTPTFPTT